MDISNKEIYEKLLHIEKLLSEEKKEEEKIIEGESKIVEEEKKIKDIIFKKENKKFSDVLEWKMYVWENCSHKKHDMITQTKIGFLCDLTKKACDFLNCPENVDVDKK